MKAPEPTAYAVCIASNVAMEQHHKQVRKYTGEPYWNHCKAVATTVEEWGGTENMICAAWLHDTVEDTGMTVERLQMLFGPGVANLVDELTDVYTHEEYPNLNRRERKKREAERLARCSLEARVIKLADLADNTSDIVKNDPKFAKTYLEEKAYVLAHIGESLDQWRNR
jgi:(p)ppGpp synthase/HD superfamily hydrolase